MPTYAYGCETCSHRFDAFQRFADDPLRECPECGAPIRRLIQPVGVVFKGSGWYITDSRPQAKDDAVAAKADGKTDGKTADKATAKADAPATEGSAPAAKPEAAKPATPAKATATAAD